MSSFIISTSDSSSKPSSQHVDETTVRQTMQNLFLHDNLSAGDDEDLDNNHAKFTSIFLIYFKINN